MNTFNHRIYEVRFGYTMIYLAVSATSPMLYAQGFSKQSAVNALYQLVICDSVDEAKHNLDSLDDVIIPDGLPEDF